MLSDATPALVCQQSIIVLNRYKIVHDFLLVCGQPFKVCKTVSPILSDRCLSYPVCLSVTLVYCCQTVGWINKDETWYAGRPSANIVRWGHSSPPPKRRAQPPIFGHVRCGQMAGWINMPLGMKVGLGPGDFVLDGDPAPRPKKGTQPHNFRPTSIAAKRLDSSGYHLVRLSPSDTVLVGTQLPTPILGPCPLSPNGWMD